jgi:hypothetical protein
MVDVDFFQLLFSNRMTVVTLSLMTEVEVHTSNGRFT